MTIAVHRPAPLARARHIRPFRALALSAAFAAASLLAACGGGGGGDTDPMANVPEAPAATADALLPEDLKSAPYAESCRQLLSLDYRVIWPKSGGTLDQVVGTLKVNASTLSTETPAGTITWTRAGQGCAFAQVGGNGELLVTESGVIVGSLANSPVIAFPIQTFTVEHVASNWTLLGQEKSGSGFINFAADLAIARDGSVARIERCPHVMTCEKAVFSPGGALTANPAGGFDLDLAGEGASRLFAYRAGGTSTLAGELMMVMVRDNGSFSLMTRRRTRTLPPVASDFQTHSNLFVSPQLLTEPVSETSIRITATDASTQSFTRRVQTPGLLRDLHPETIAINKPHTGYQYRPAVTAPVAYPEWTLLPLRGMGFSVLAFTETDRFMFSVPQQELPASSAVASLPENLAALATTTSCNALRSTVYRVITPRPGSDIDGNIGELTMNAATLRSSLDGGATLQWRAVAGSPCRFDVQFTSNHLVVAQSGVISALMPFATTGGVLSHRPLIGFPKQTIAVAELAGAWNTLGMDQGTSFFQGSLKTLTLNMQGVATNAGVCDPTGICTFTPPTDLSLRSNVDGGFDLGPAAGPVDRVYAYRAGGGELMVVRVSPNGSFSLMTRERPVTVPAVTSPPTNRWNLTVESDLEVKEVLLSSVSVSAVGSSQATYNSSWYPFPLRYLLNSPTKGYLSRLGDNTTFPSTPAAAQLDLRGMGLQISIEPSWYHWDLAVERP